MAALKEIKEVKRARLTEYKNYRPNSEYHEGQRRMECKSVTSLFHVQHRTSCIWKMQNSLLQTAATLVAEGANMPTTLEATRVPAGERCYLSHLVKQPMPAVLQHPHWKCLRTASV